jgi:hypothetical protein
LAEFRQKFVLACLMPVKRGSERAVEGSAVVLMGFAPLQASFMI